MICKFQLEFGSKAVHLGNELSIAETANMPTVISWPTEPDTLYTLIFIGQSAFGLLAPRHP